MKTYFPAALVMTGLRRIGLSLLLLAAAASAAAYERPYNRYSTDLLGQRIAVQVVDLSGQPFPIYRANGQYYVPGEKNQRYALRVTNRHHQRVLVVMSVDGVNVVTGQTAGWRQPGYVLEPGQSTVIEGWRKSMHDVARFFFTHSANSYAERTGRPNDLGVMGFAVFDERYRQPVPVIYENERYEHDGLGRAQDSARPSASAVPAPSAPAAKSASAERGVSAQSHEERIGTGHGERSYSRVYSTEFERASHNPAEVLSLRYDTLNNLVRQGIVPSYYRRHGNQSNPFPQEGFTPDPR